MEDVVMETWTIKPAKGRILVKNVEDVVFRFGESKWTTEQETIVQMAQVYGISPWENEADGANNDTVFFFKGLATKITEELYVLNGENVLAWKSQEEMKNEKK